MKKMLSSCMILACLFFLSMCYDDGGDTTEPVIDDSCTDVDMPVFLCPEANMHDTVLPLGIKITAFDVEFKVTDESEIVRIVNARKVTNDTYVVQCGDECLKNFHSSETIIEMQDACGNVNSKKFVCKAELAGAREFYGWPWLLFYVYYHFE